ncbi:hypothetical protein HN51_045569 [Arachis hypogaea]
MSPAIKKKTSPVKETEMAAESQITGEEQGGARRRDEEQEIRDNAVCACKLLKEKEMMVDGCLVQGSGEQFQFIEDS